VGDRVVGIRICDSRGARGGQPQEASRNDLFVRKQQAEKNTVIYGDSYLLFFVVSEPNEIPRRYPSGLPPDVPISKLIGEFRPARLISVHNDFEKAVAAATKRGVLYAIRTSASDFDQGFIADLRDGVADDPVSNDEPRPNSPEDVGYERR